MKYGWDDIDPTVFIEDGTIQKIIQTTKGVDPVKPTANNKRK